MTRNKNTTSPDDGVKKSQARVALLASGFKGSECSWASLVDGRLPQVQGRRGEKRRFGHIVVKQEGLQQTFNPKPQKPYENPNPPLFAGEAAVQSFLLETRGRTIGLFWQTNDFPGAAASPEAASSIRITATVRLIQIDSIITTIRKRVIIRRIAIDNN